MLFMFAASQCSHMRKQEFMCSHGLSDEVWVSGVGGIVFCICYPEYVMKP